MRLLPIYNSFDFMKISQFTQNYRQKVVWSNPNLRVRKETMVDTCGIHAKHGRVRSTLKRILPEIINPKDLAFVWPRKAIPAHSDGFKQWLRGNIILIHMSIMMLLKQLWICVLIIITKIKTYNI